MAALSLERVGRSPRTYELRDGDVVLGVLRYPRRGSDRAEAESPEGGWQMPARGAYRAEGAVMSADGGIAIGWVRRRRWRGGADLAMHGREFTLHKASWWRGTWVLDEGDDDLLGAGSRYLSTRKPLTIEIYTDVPVPLILLTSHLILLSVRDESAAAGGAAAASVAASG
jgi:hypothetical protein